MQVNVTDFRTGLSTLISGLEETGDIQVTKGGDVVAILTHPLSRTAAPPPPAVKPEEPSEPHRIRLLRANIFDTEANLGHPGWASGQKNLPIWKQELRQWETSQKVAPDPDAEDLGGLAGEE